MKLLSLVFLGIIAVLLFSGDQSVKTESIETISGLKYSSSSTLDNLSLTAKAYGVFDMETGEILAGHNVEDVLPIASVTKLFTAEAVLETAELSEDLVVTEADVATEGRSGKLATGQKYPARELLFPLLLESSNDAAATLVRLVKKIPFADKAWADGSGLSANNQASVVELSGEVRRLYKERPHIFDITTLKQHIGDYTGWVNNSPLQSLPGYQGGKHGYTEAAGKTVVAIFSEENLAGRELGYVVLGSDDIKQDVVLLRNEIERSVYLE